jgi:hypothetical protein
MPFLSLLMRVLTNNLGQTKSMADISNKFNFFFFTSQFITLYFSSIQTDLWCYLLGLHCGMKMDIPCLFVYYEIRVHTHTTEDQYELNSEHTMTGSVYSQHIAFQPCSML